jgi:hypothetical protein
LFHVAGDVQNTGIGGQARVAIGFGLRLAGKIDDGEAGLLLVIERLEGRERRSHRCQ